MDIRYWWTNLVGQVGGLACIGGLIAVGWHYADTGNVAAGIAVFGMGTGLTAGVYGVSHIMNRRRAALEQSPNLSQN